MTDRPDQADRPQWREPDDTDEFDPWKSFPEQQEEDSLAARPNWWVVATAGLGFLVVLLLVLLARNIRSDDELQETVSTIATTSSEGTDEAVDNSSTSSTASSPSAGGGSVSTVEITETVAPSGCLPAVGTATGEPLEAFLNAALSQQGKPYEFGAASADPSDPEPASFDTSELVKWAAARAGVDLVDGSWLQYLALVECGSTVPVETALTTPGALVFGFPSEPTDEGRPPGAFVAVSLGDGQRLIDAQPSAGVGVYPVSSRSLTHAVLIPNIGQGTAEYLP